MATGLDHGGQLGVDPLASAQNPYTSDISELRPKRRQNTSCDQCRHGKRACDLQYRSTHRRPGQTGRIICSMCEKKGKVCTADWLHSQRQAAEIPIKRRRVSTGESLSSYNETAYPQDFAQQTPQMYGEQPLHHLFADQIQPVPTSIPQVSTFDPSISEIPPVSHPALPTRYLHVHPPESSVAPSVGWTSIESSTDEYNLDYFPVSDGDQTRGNYPDRSTEETDDVDACLGLDYSDDWTSFSSSENLIHPLATQQVLGGSHYLVDHYHRALIKRNLLKVYHDSMEGALGCWLNERNCPYSLELERLDTHQAWSSNFSNRILNRVFRLDTEYSRHGGLTAAEQKQANRALNLAVSAFAAQWCPSDTRGMSHPSANQHSNPLASDAQAIFGSPIASTISEHLRENAFDASMQGSLWHETSKALGEASGNKSFKVIFACIIFSLTQRPIEESYSSRLTSLEEILECDSSHTFLDIALRSLHTHRRMFDDAKRFKSARFTAHAKLAASWENTSERADRADGGQQTFNFLFWCAVMFDSLSAAMHRRAFVVDDDDSALDDPGSRSRSNGVPGSDADDSSTYPQGSKKETKDLSIWGNYFLRTQSNVGDVRAQEIRLPCSYDDACRALSDAAPVKVLLYRRVAHLQGLLYKRSTPDAIENAINAALEVYNHWNRTYGRFIHDCTVSHDSLQSRIQSWYVILAGHWHLAVLILADLIEDIDESSLSPSSSRRARNQSQFCAHLRHRSGVAVSELARSAQRPDAMAAFTEFSSFHDVVNKTALLTEPWTSVLIRTFAYAGTVFAKKLNKGNAQLDDAQRQALDLHPQDGIDSLEQLADSRERLQLCIQALWVLGKKSNMATLVANLLSKQSVS